MTASKRLHVAYDLSDARETDAPDRWRGLARWRGFERQHVAYDLSDARETDALDSTADLFSQLRARACNFAAVPTLANLPVESKTRTYYDRVETLRRRATRGEAARQGGTG